MRAGLWYPISGSNPAEKILSAPSFGGEVKPSVPCRKFTACKINKSDVEVAAFGKILRNFSTIVPPSATGVRLRRFRRWRLLVAEGGTF